MYRFDLVKPDTIEGAVEALGQEDAQALGGGQTLIPTLKQRLASPSVLVSLSGIREMQQVRFDQGELSIGGAVTHAAVAAQTADHYPALSALAGQIGDPAVRNRGTIGGSLANNDPSACYPAAALGGAATIVTNSRSIDADDFFEGMFETALEEGEVITDVRFPIPQQAAYVKFNQPASRFAMVGVFVALFRDGARVAVTGASEEGVFRWSAAENQLSDNFTADAIKGLTIDDDGLISDLHAASDYRAHLVSVMTQRAISVANAA